MSGDGEEFTVVKLEANEIQRNGMENVVYLTRHLRDLLYMKGREQNLTAITYSNFGRMSLK
uniref:Uncharacterized protein n=1 Tax=Megaselia scalaris TaxID=36166 RepID=T1GJ73_MEGSC